MRGLIWGPRFVAGFGWSLLCVLAYRPKDSNTWLWGVYLSSRPVELLGAWKGSSVMRVEGVRRVVRWFGPYILATQEKKEKALWLRDAGKPRICEGDVLSWEPKKEES